MQFVRRLTNCKIGYFRRSKTLSFPFCSGVVSNKEPATVLEDWEYCRKISSELKNNNINQAINCLFQSYLNGKILDIQIYNSVFEKINEQSFPLSYAEILYEVYREHFPPNGLIHNWMSKLTYSSNQKLIEKLKLDYQALGQPYPARSLRNIKKQSKKQLKTDKGESSNTDENNPAPKRSRSRKVDSQPINIDEISKINLNNYEDMNKQITQDMTNEDFIRMKYANDIKEMLESLNLGLENYSKVIIKDVEIIMNNPQENMNNMHEHHNSIEYDEENENQEEEYFGLDINKIKIGKIELIKDPKDKNNQ